MKTIRPFVFALSLALGALAGCGDVAEGGAAAITVTPLDQSWSLDGVGAWRVPVSIGVAADASRQISAGSLTVRADWTWELRYDYRDLGANLDASGTHVSAGTYRAREGAPSTFDFRNAATGSVYVATVNADGSVDLPLGGLRYHFVVPQ